MKIKAVNKPKKNVKKLLMKLQAEINKLENKNIRLDK